MFDKNGVEIKTGDIVKVEGGFFKRDNGLFVVKHVPGDPNWCGKDISLTKISKGGKISTTKHKTAFFPIFVTVNDYFKKCEAKEWNKEHATIEVVQIKNMDEVKEHFESKIKEAEDRIEWTKWNFGEQHPEVEMMENIKKHYKTVVERIA